MQYVFTTDFAKTDRLSACIVGSFTWEGTMMRVVLSRRLKGERTNSSGVERAVTEVIPATVRATRGRKCSSGSDP